jgi:aryl-alcohol dehydrogenase-like predicted oxidoreductase
VLSRGLISGHWTKEREAVIDFRAVLPRFRGESLNHNRQLVDALRREAAKLGATVAQVAISWVLSRGDDIVPLVGARQRGQLTEALGALGLSLSRDQLAAIEQAVPKDAAAGTRYALEHMVQLDSEISTG